jgi:hypothetical protein
MANTLQPEPLSYHLQEERLCCGWSEDTRSGNRSPAPSGPQLKKNQPKHGLQLSRLGLIKKRVLHDLLLSSSLFWGIRWPITPL